MADGPRSQARRVKGLGLGRQRRRGAVAAVTPETLILGQAAGGAVQARRAGGPVPSTKPERDPSERRAGSALWARALGPRAGPASLYPTHGAAGHRRWATDGKERLTAGLLAPAREDGRDGHRTITALVGAAVWRGDGPGAWSGSGDTRASRPQPRRQERHDPCCTGSTSSHPPKPDRSVCQRGQELYSDLRVRSGCCGRPLLGLGRRQPDPR
jgi:hypothetical protein